MINAWSEKNLFALFKNIVFLSSTVRTNTWEKDQLTFRYWERKINNSFDANWRKLTQIDAKSDFFKWLKGRCWNFCQLWFPIDCFCYSSAASDANLRTCGAILRRSDAFLRSSMYFSATVTRFTQMWWLLSCASWNILPNMIHLSTSFTHLNVPVTHLK